MRLGLYTFASLAFIGLVAGFAYTLAPGNYVLEVAGLNLNLPVAIWIVMPLLILLLLTLLHMLYHSTRNYFGRRKWLRDADTMQDALYWSLIGEPKAHNYVIPNMREGAALLSTARLSLTDLPEGLSPRLSKTVAWIQQIQNGDYVDLKEKKVERFLGKENALLIHNQCNRLSKEPEYADTILREKEQYADTCVQHALAVSLKKDTFFKLKKYAGMLTFADLEILLDRADAGEDVGLTLENMTSFIEDMELSCREYMRLVTSAIKAFDPDENLALFKGFAVKHGKAEAAYLFLLFRYEMIEKAHNFLEEQEADEYMAFRAFYTLKKEKYNYKVRDFITAENACK